MAAAVPTFCLFLHPSLGNWLLGGGLNIGCTCAGTSSRRILAVPCFKGPTDILLCCLIQPLGGHWEQYLEQTRAHCVSCEPFPCRSTCRGAPFCTMCWNPTVSAYGKFACSPCEYLVIKMAVHHWPLPVACCSCLVPECFIIVSPVGMLVFLIDPNDRQHVIKSGTASGNFVDKILTYVVKAFHPS